MPTTDITFCSQPDELSATCAECRRNVLIYTEQYREQLFVKPLSYVDFSICLDETGCSRFLEYKR